MPEVLGTSVGTITKGQRKLSDIAGPSANNPGRKVPQWVKDGVIPINANVVPMLKIMEKKGVKKTVGDAIYNHLDNDDLPTTVTVDANSYTSGVVSITLASGNGKRVTEGDTLLCLRTEELVYVSSVAGDTIQVERGEGGTTAATINASEVLNIIDSAHADGATAPESISSEPNIRQNACQIFRTSLEISGRNKNAEVEGGDEWSRAWMDTGKKHALKMERAFMFSNGRTLTGNRTRTGGFPYWVTSNIFNNAGANLTEAYWQDFGRAWLRRNAGVSPNDVGILHGELVSKALSGFMRDDLRYETDDEIGGIYCAKYRFDQGQTVNLIKHGLFSPVGSDETAANKGWQGMAYGVWFSGIGCADFKGRTGQTQKDIQTPGADGKKDALLDDKGFVLLVEKRHAKLLGVAG